MTVPSGVYIIRPVAKPDQAVLIGPVPLIWPPPPAPLLTVPGRRTEFTLTQVGGDSTISANSNHTVVEAREAKTVVGIEGSQGAKKQTWTLEADGPGIFRIKDPESGKYWEDSEIDWDSISLQGKGPSRQQWIFEPASS
ncbi:unnamed protein product [Rhizoctonia solani]|uniref:Uncharacterized protein n=1 Tax=Rhizoctonia solani TaxID=456999 RepID=A0A8H3CY21_9AGAM|nr:unnamed protein product [Rhizoctonia solani]CAE7170172.1 unnamed protein product [Rhizoctonia solani]